MMNAIRGAISPMSITPMRTIALRTAGFVGVLTARLG